jgi:hypothetical protein
LLVGARVGFADLSATFVQVPISAAAKAADPTGFLNTATCWSLRVTNTDGHWEQAGLRMTLPAGSTFYNTVPGRAGQDTHPGVAFFAVFPDVEFDTYVSSPRNQFGTNAPAIVGGFPDTLQPHSMGGASDPLPGVLAVAWGDPAPTQGPGPGTYEICRFTFPLGVVPTIDPLSQTAQVNPTRTIFIPADIPEPAAAGLLSVVALALRRGSRGAR